MTFSCQATLTSTSKSGNLCFEDEETEKFAGVGSKIFKNRNSSQLWEKLEKMAIYIG